VARIAPNNDIDACGLTFSELQELWLGPCNGSVFTTPEQLRDAWVQGRDVAMRLWAHDGKRPLGWWVFEAGNLGLKWPGYDHQPAYLYEHNALEETEKAELERSWRLAFDSGRKAGIPAGLVRQWQAERRRKKSAPVSASGAENPGGLRSQSTLIPEI